MAKIDKTRAIIERWPSRKEMALDVGRDVIVVHRWYQRGSIPGEYDAALLRGAAQRRIGLTPDELIAARSTYSPREAAE